MESLVPDVHAKTRVHFPDTRSVLIALLEKFSSNGFHTHKTFDELLDYCFRKIEAVRDICHHYHQSKIAGLLSDAEMSLELSSDSLESITQQLSERWKAPNEFFTIFDMTLGKEVHVDERMYELLGLEPHQFYSSTTEALDPDITIYYRDDLFHSMRFAMICYMVMCMPGFVWQSQRDHYLARIRLSTKNSSKESIRQLPFITIEKRCYFMFDNTQSEIRVPQYHFDRYTVYPDMEEEYVYHKLISDDKQSAYMNAFSYLINLYLLGIAPKYILLLDERQTHDRNKTVAAALQEKIRQHTGRMIAMDEHKIADCFAKTIRHNIEEAYNHWDMRSNGHRIHITSDAESVHYAKKLGLLPIPSKVRDMMYGLIAEH